LTLVFHFDLELQKMDVKTKFLNGDLQEEVYLKQSKGFSSSSSEHLIYKLNRSIYGLKQASCQWYLKFHEIIYSFVFSMKTPWINAYTTGSVGVKYVFLFYM